MDQYASVFEELEKESEMYDRPGEDRGRDRRSSPKRDRRLSLSPKRDQRSSRSPKRDRRSSRSPKRDRRSSRSPRRERRSSRSPRRERRSSRSPKPQRSHFKTEARRIDELPLEGMNPLNEPPKAESPPKIEEPKNPSPEITKSKSPKRSRSRSKSAPKKKQRKRSSSRSSGTSLSSLSSVDLEVKTKEEKPQKDDKVFEDFLKEEKQMLSWMDGEKRRFLSRPESHRGYTSEWNHFYERKCKQEGVKVHPSMVKDEWDYHWQKFIEHDQRRQIQEEGHKLLRHFGLRNREVKAYQERKAKRSLSPISNNSEDEKADVLNTMRILSAMENLLGPDQGQKANIFLAKAKSLELKEGSKELLEKQDFVDFLRDCQEILQSKLNEGIVKDTQSKGVRTCLDKIIVILQSSSLKPTAKVILNLEKYQDPLKYRIAQTIIQHFKQMGNEVGQDDLDALVMSEFNRLQDQQSWNYQQHQEMSYQNQPSSSGINWNAIQSAVQTVTTSQPEQPRQPEVPQEESGAEEYEDLSIDELTSLFRNFKDLDPKMQTHLIGYMKRLEKTNPAKVKEFKLHLHSAKNDQ